MGKLYQCHNPRCDTVLVLHNVTMGGTGLSVQWISVLPLATAYEFTIISIKISIKNKIDRSAWLAQSVEHVTLDLRVRSSSAMLGVEIP